MKTKGKPTRSTGLWWAPMKRREEDLISDPVRTHFNTFKVVVCETSDRGRGGLYVSAWLVFTADLRRRCGNWTQRKDTWIPESVYLLTAHIWPATSPLPADTHIFPPVSDRCGGSCLFWKTPRAASGSFSQWNRRVWKTWQRVFVSADAYHPRRRRRHGWDRRAGGHRRGWASERRVAISVICRKTQVTLATSSPTIEVTILQ